MNAIREEIMVRNLASDELAKAIISREDITMNTYTVVIPTVVPNTTITVTTDDPKKIFDLFPNLVSLTLVTK